MQKGFTLLAVLFVMVFLSLFSALLMQNLHFNQVTANYDLLMLRAKFAAISGLNIAAKEIRTNPCPQLHMLYPKQYGALYGFKVDVECVDMVVQAKVHHGQFAEDDYVEFTEISKTGK